MNEDFYLRQITSKSWQLLTRLHKAYDFILIGGWAVYLYTQALKSKDIDIIVDYDVLAGLQRDFSLVKNDRLRKYEIKKEEIDIDIYVPFYSDPGLPVRVIRGYTTKEKGFTVPKPEILLILKQNVYNTRQFSAKGQKDRIDIMALLNLDLDWALYRKVLQDQDKVNFTEELAKLIKETRQVPELDLNPHKFAKLKKSVLTNL